MIALIIYIMACVGFYHRTRYHEQNYYDEVATSGDGLSIAPRYKTALCSLCWPFIALCDCIKAVCDFVTE